MADHRAQHGRQVDFSAPVRADRRCWPRRAVSCRLRGPALGSSTGCSAELARRTISRAAGRPSWSRWSRPPPSSPRRRREAWSSWMRSGAVHRPTTGWHCLGGGRGDARQVQARTLFATHYHELTRLADRLDACRSIMSGRANGRATLSCCTKSPTARPTELRHRRCQACRLPPTVVARAKSVLAKLEAVATRPAGLPRGSTICRCSPPSNRIQGTTPWRKPWLDRARLR